MATIRPFQFVGLPRLSAEQVAVQQTLASYLATEPFSSSFVNDLAGELERYLKAPCRFSEPQTRPMTRGDLEAVLPAVGCLMVIGAAPSEHKILVDLDPGLASFIIERLLGGSGDSARLQRPLTEIEEGVLSFIILKVLGYFQGGWRTGHELALTLDRFATRFDDVRHVAENESGYHMLGISASFGSRIGYARIFLPNGLISTSFAAPPAQNGATGEELVYIRRLLGSLGQAAVAGRVEVTNIDLSPDDIANLEAGDIILLENHQVTKTPDGLDGEVFVRLGLGKNGGLRAHVSCDGEQTRLQITEIVIQEEPQEADMADGEGGDEMQEAEAPADAPEAEAEAAEPAAPGPDDNLAETEGLLRDVPAPVVVELGRIRLNTSQVVRLRSGQILRLPRGPNDPVDLVVNGKIFARGELIEVDGELGVRLLQVVGAG